MTLNLYLFWQLSVIRLQIQGFREKEELASRCWKLEGIWRQLGPMEARTGKSKEVLKVRSDKGCEASIGSQLCDPFKPTGRLASGLEKEVVLKKGNRC